MRMHLVAAAAVLGFALPAGAQTMKPGLWEIHNKMSGGQMDQAMADMQAYRDFAGTVLWQLPGVRETRTYAVMEEVKSSTRLLLRP